MTDYQLDKEIAGRRSNDFAIQSLILNRWSPRSFLQKPVPEEELLAVLDAARWAPSCFNEQPWRYLVARHEGSLKKMQACLAESNQRWAGNAPVLIALLSKPDFTESQKPNRWQGFDAGASWVCLALEAKARGLIAHAMGGFSPSEIRTAFDVPEDWGIHAVIALGYQGPADLLPDDIKDREKPTTRKPLHEIWSDGQFDFK